MNVSPSNRMHSITCVFLISTLCVLALAHTSDMDSDDETDFNSHIERITFLLVSQRQSSYHISRAEALKTELLRQAAVWKLKFNPQVLTVHEDFDMLPGAWAIWPIMKELNDYAYDFHGGDKPYWLIVLNVDTLVRLDMILDILKDKQPTNSHFIGHPLVDESTTIIHHFSAALDDAKHRNDAMLNDKQFDSPEDAVLRYPSFTAGFLMSSGLINKYVQAISESESNKLNSFAIDAKYELADSIYKLTGTRLEYDNSLCCTKRSQDCATEYRPPLSKELLVREEEGCHNEVDNPDIVFGVKTFHEHHKSRVVVVKRTWAKYAAVIEFFSDQEDVFIPSVVLEVNNTESGHCQKTMLILRHFYELLEYQDKKWLVVADDDTLLSVSRLVSLLSCYDSTQPIILGERYGYGFTKDGAGGYDYPTGGSGMLFTRSAINLLLEHCNCPSDDAPDDMIIGMCAKSLNIPVLHSDSFHQARPNDYAVDYLLQEPAISFHKHWEVDPYQVFVQYLQDQQDTIEGAYHVAHDADEQYYHQHKTEL